VLHPFPKIFALGTTYVRDIFSDDVEVTEKVDGSQFVFGQVNGALSVRSKGAVIDPAAPPSMFRQGVDYVAGLWAGRALPEGVVYFCEYLQKPKHNVLAYTRTPKNGLCLFAVYDPIIQGFSSSRERLVYEATQLDIDPVPLLRAGRVESMADLAGFMEQDSYLGGVKVEGVVVKNHHRPFLLGGQPIPLMSGKYVSEAFKEVHRGKRADYSGKGRWETFVDSHRSEARWAKAAQHLRETGSLTGTPADIARLVTEVKRDVLDEERAEIERVLWREFAPEVARKAVSGLPDWYKAQLAAGALPTAVAA
jgi:hypothetical protein